jgi:hypothetical protein
MRLYILCEGETEYLFVKNILYNYLLDSGVYAIPRIIHTKRTANKTYKGGVSNYNKIRKDLYLLCKEQENSGIVTTMFDYYKLPGDSPGFKNAAGSIFERACHIESAIEADLGNLRNLIVNIILHEFEGLLFSDVNAFHGVAKGDKNVIAELARIKSIFPSPEDINDSETTAPSKRIKNILPDFSKTLNGIEVAKSIGIVKISEQCRHFKQWLEKIESCAKDGAQ